MSRRRLRLVSSDQVAGGGPRMNRAVRGWAESVLLDTGASTHRWQRGVTRGAASATSALSLAEPIHRPQLSCSQSTSACAAATIWLQTSNALSTISTAPCGNLSPRHVLRGLLMQRSCWAGSIRYNISITPYCQLPLMVENRCRRCRKIESQHLPSCKKGLSQWPTVKPE